MRQDEVREKQAQRLGERARQQAEGSRPCSQSLKLNKTPEERERAQKEMISPDPFVIQRNFVHAPIPQQFHSLQNLQPLKALLLPLEVLLGTLLFLRMFCLLSWLLLTVQVSYRLKVVGQVNKASESVEGFQPILFDLGHLPTPESVFDKVHDFVFLEDLFQVVLPPSDMDSIVPKDQREQGHPVLQSEVLERELSPLPPEVLQLHFQQSSQVLHKFREKVNKSTEIVPVEIVAIKADIIDLLVFKHCLNQRLARHLPQQHVVVLEDQDQLASDPLHGQPYVAGESVPLLHFSHSDQLILSIEGLQVHLELLILGDRLGGESACLASVLVALFVAVAQDYHRHVREP